MSYEIGDVVVLKSGGPRMTVEAIQKPSGDLRCVWFATVEKIEAIVLHPDAVRKPTEEKDTKSVLSMHDGEVKHRRI